MAEFFKGQVPILNNGLKLSGQNAGRIYQGGNVIRGVAPEPGVPWTPSDNANLFVWYDISDVSTVTTSSNLGFDYVEQWDDKSGNGYNATQTTAANRPTYGINTLNGVDLATFGATSAIQLNIPVTPYANNDVSLYVVAQYRNKGSWQSTVLFNRAGSQFVAFLLEAGAGGGNYNIYTQTFYEGSTALVDPSANFFSFVGDDATSNMDFWLNGTSDGSTGAGNFGSTSVFSGGQGYLGNDNYGSYSISDLAEVVLIDGKDSTTDRQKMEGYLAWKWGLQSKLPLGHPYKNAAPTV